jgi:hypothetical protein
MPVQQTARMRIAVEAYAGHKADERPVSFTLEGRRLRIREIVDRWCEPGCNGFRVLAEDGRTYQLRHMRQTDTWELDSFRAP